MGKKYENKKIAMDLCISLKAVDGIMKSKKDIHAKINLLSVYIKDIVQKFSKAIQTDINNIILKNEWKNFTDHDSVLQNITTQWIMENTKKCTEFLDSIGISKKDRKQYLEDIIDNKPVVLEKPSHKKNDYSYASTIARKNTL